MDERERALASVGRMLREADYEFVTVTPETHRRVLARSRDASLARDLRDVFGWSRPFSSDLLPKPMLDALGRGGALVETPAGFRSAVRFSSLGEHLFVHSAFPTTDADAVFFGPDTYRFCALVARYGARARRAVDVGCGSGAGGLVASRFAERVVLTDVNERALSCARVNAELANATDRVEIVQSDVLAAVDGDIDLVVANPPYMKDAAARTYRDGGGAFGEALSVRIARESLMRLSSGGTLVLYTGAAIVDGVDTFRSAVMPIAEASGARTRYEEIDPDVFGEELDQPGYAAVERIAAVSLVATRS